MGVHNLEPGSKSPITGARPDSCAYCHAPHSGLNIGLWNQKLTTQIYTTYNSSTAKNKDTQPMLGTVSNQCLSCHDGTVAVGATVAYGQVTTRGSMNSPDVFGSNMQSSHPFSLALPLQDNINLVASLAANGTTADPTGAVKLIKGNVECTSCHNPHVQAKDLISQNFLVKDSSNGQLCLACHDPSRTASGAGESAGRLAHQRTCSLREQDIAAGPARKLSHGCGRCLHLLPCAAQCERSSTPAARAERAGLHCLPQRRNECFADADLRQRVSRVRNSQGRPSVSRVNQSARCN